jgi:hypothetical protein
MSDPSNELRNDLASDTPPLPAADAPRPGTELVCAFLADQDVACPKCGYNLRGVGEPTCPECGREIELALASPGRSRGYLLFVLLALGWVLIAGGMNAYRTWKVVQTEATPRRQTLVTFTSAGSFSTSGPGGTTTRTWRSTSGTPTVTFNTQGGVTVTTPSGVTTVPAGRVPAGGSAGGWTTTGPVAVTPARPAAAKWAWANVSQRTWINLGWWSGLGVLALGTLMVVLVRRRRFDRHSPPRGIMIAACALFVLYAGYHAVMFSREFI